jgi:parvulin-like peptidyl-prolyl isomerase
VRLYSSVAVRFLTASEVLVKRRLSGIILVLVVVALAGFAVACGNSQLPGDAAAKVGDTYISAAKLDAAVAQEAAAYGITKDENPDIYREVQKYVIENLVATELAAQEAAKLRISVTDADVQTEFDNYVNSYYSGDQSSLETALAAEGLTLDDFKKSIKDGLLTNKVRDEVVKDVTTVPEDKVAAYYAANLTGFYVEPSRGLRHILIKPVATGTATTTATDSSGTSTSSTGGTSASSSAPTATLTDADWAKALDTANEVRRKLATGGSWDKLAAQYSGDFATKDKGGDLGTIKAGETLKAFEEAAFALDLNEISQPVKTPYGYEIIQATAVTLGGQQSLEEVRSQIVSQLLTTLQDEAWNKWLEEQKTAVGVVYRDDLKPAPTTTTTEATTTTLAGATSTAVPSETTTTVEP